MITGFLACFGYTNHWVSHSFPPLPQPPFKHSLPCLFVTADGGLLIFGCVDGVVRVYDPDESAGAESVGHRASVRGLCWNATGDGFASASADSTVRIWARDGTERLQFAETHCIKPGSAPLNCVALSPDGTALVCGGTDNYVRLFGIEGRSAVPLCRCSSQRLHVSRVRTTPWSSTLRTLHFMGTGVDESAFVVPLSPHPMPSSGHAEELMTKARTNWNGQRRPQVSYYASRDGENGENNVIYQRVRSPRRLHFDILPADRIRIIAGSAAQRNAAPCSTMARCRQVRCGAML